MNSTLLIKLLGGLTATAGVGTGGYFLKEHFSKSKEKPEAVVKPQGENETAKAPQSPAIKPSGDATNTDTNTQTNQDVSTQGTKAKGKGETEETQTISTDQTSEQGEKTKTNTPSNTESRGTEGQADEIRTPTDGEGLSQ